MTTEIGTDDLAFFFVRVLRNTNLTTNLFPSAYTSCTETEKYIGMFLTGLFLFRDF